MCGGGGGGGGNSAAVEQQQREAERAEREAAENRKRTTERENRIRSGSDIINSQFGRFSPEFYQRRGKAYVDHAMPDLEKQYQDAREALTYALAQAGILRSSEATKRFARLEEDKSAAITAVQSEGQRQTALAQQAVEDERAGLLDQLNATGDMDAASNAALARGQSLSENFGTTAGFSPLGQMFGNVATGIGNYVSGTQRREVLSEPITPADPRATRGRVISQKATG